MKRKNNNTKKLLGIILVIIGSVLLVWGYNEARSVNSEISRLFSGNPTQNTMVYYIAGSLCLAMGVFTLFRSR